jgi:tetratricopeptide (TPR) repeat protein
MNGTRRGFGRLWASCLLAACGAAPTPAGPGQTAPPAVPTGVGVVEVAPVRTAPSAVPAHVVVPPQPDQDERIAAVLEHVGALAANERYLDALATLDDALAAAPAPQWQAARAAVLRGLGRREVALDQLDALVAAVGPAELHPGLLFERAELAWICGRREAATTALAQLQRIHAGDVWLARHAAELDGLAAELRHAERAGRMRVGDLLGDLRGAPAVEVRTAAFLRAVEADAAGAEGMAEGELVARAVGIAAGDPEPHLRALAVRYADPDPAALAEFCAMALADPSPLVRSVAVQRATALPREAAATLLVAAMQSAPTAELHLQIHEALLLVGCVGPDLPPDLRGNVGGRSRHAEAWRAAIVGK